MHVIGLVGEKGSGKGTFVNLLKEVAEGRRIFSTRFSDLLRETLTLWSIPHSRSNLQRIKVIMDENFGVEVFPNAVLERLQNVDADIVVLDGVRWKEDVSLVRRFPKNILVYVTAPPQVRYMRTVLRGEKVGENESSLEQFLEEEQAANELLIPKIGMEADCIIENDESVEAYKGAVSYFYKVCFS